MATKQEQAVAPAAPEQAAPAADGQPPQDQQPAPQPHKQKKEKVVRSKTIDRWNYIVMAFVVGYVFAPSSSFYHRHQRVH